MYHIYCSQSSRLCNSVQLLLCNVRIHHSLRLARIHLLLQHWTEFLCNVTRPYNTPAHNWAGLPVVIEGWISPEAVRQPALAGD